MRHLAALAEPIEAFSKTDFILLICTFKFDHLSGDLSLERAGCYFLWFYSNLTLRGVYCLSN